MNLNQILNSKNIADQLDGDKLSKIATQVTERFNLDLQSRKQKQDELETIVKLAMAVANEKSFPWPNASNVIFPLISTAIIEFGAKCSPEILRDDAVVKAKIIGKDDGKLAFSVNGDPIVNPETGEQDRLFVGAKQERGDRVAAFMNWQLFEEIKNWAEDTDKLCTVLACVGTMFRKTYFDKVIKDELIYPDKLIVHDKATDFDYADITHILEIYEPDIQRKIRSGFFKDFSYQEDTADSSALIAKGISQANNATENKGVHTFLEQCCYLDLDEDDFLEPYVVTVHKRTNTVVRITPRFTKDDITKEGNKIVDIKAENPYTVYSFIPSPDGSFYAIGLGHLLLNLNRSINSSINQLTDAGTLQTTGGGFIAKSLKIQGGAFKMKPNEYKMVDAFGSSIRDSIVSLPTPEPSQTLFALLGFLAQSGKELGSLREVLTGENAANIQATTMMAMVEQGMTQFRSVYKRIYRSLKQEFKKIYDINTKHLDEKKYADVLDETITKVSAKLDFEKGGFDIVPVADITSVTNSQRMAKASFLMQFLNDPYIDQIQLREKILSSFNIDNYRDLIVAPAPSGPDANTIFAQSEMVKAENKMKEVQIKSIEASAALEKGRYDIEKIIAEIEKIKTESIKNIADSVNKEKQVQIDSIVKTAETIRKGIESRAKELKTNETDNEEENETNNEQEDIDMVSEEAVDTE